jgi:hypothetical protein
MANIATAKRFVAAWWSLSIYFLGHSLGWVVVTMSSSGSSEEIRPPIVVFVNFWDCHIAL